MLQTVWKWTQINQGQLEEPFGSTSGFIDHLGAAGRLQSQIQAILGQILTFPDPPCQLGQIFMVPNGLYKCPTNSTTYSMFNSHLLGAF